MNWVARIFHKCKDFTYSEETITCPKCKFILTPRYNKYKTGYIWTIPKKFNEFQRFEIIGLLYENSPNGHIEIRIGDEL